MGKEVNPPPVERLAEIERVVARAKAGDADAIPRLRELLDEFPEIWDFYGVMAFQGLAAWAALAAGSDRYLNECLLRKAQALKVELVGEAPAPVVALAADRVIATWLEVNYFAAMEAKGLSGGEGLKILQFRGKRRLQAEQSHRNALGALASLQKLLPTARNTAPALPPPVTANFEIHNRLAGLFAATHSSMTVN